MTVETLIEYTIIECTIKLFVNRLPSMHFPRHEARHLCSQTLEL